MNKKQAWALIGLTTVGFSMPAGAQSMDEMTKRPTEIGFFKSAVDDLNSACGTSIAVTTENFDWPSFKGNLSNEAGNHVGMNCGSPVSVLKGMCNGTPAAQAAVKKGITNVKCGGTSGSQVTYSISNKVLTIGTGLQGGYDPKAMKDYFGKHL